MRYITEQGVKYRIRGPYTAPQLRALFEKFKAHYKGTKISFRGWLVGFGKVYSSVRKQ